MMLVESCEHFDLAKVIVDTLCSIVNLATKVMTDINEALVEVGYDMIMTCHLPAVKWLNLKQLTFWGLEILNCL